MKMKLVVLIKINSKKTAVNPKDSKLKKGDVLVSIDTEYYRPTEVDLLIGDATKAKKNLVGHLNTI